VNLLVEGERALDPLETGQIASGHGVDVGVLHAEGGAVGSQGDVSVAAPGAVLEDVHQQVLLQLRREFGVGGTLEFGQSARLRHKDAPAQQINSYNEHLIAKKKGREIHNFDIRDGILRQAFFIPYCVDQKISFANHEKWR
jgi:hypothetical protein